MKTRRDVFQAIADPTRRADFISIKPQKSYTAMDRFCDPDGNLNEELPRNRWDNTFTDLGERTRVDILLSFHLLEDLEKIIELGFQEGFTAGLENLDQYIAAQSYLHKNKKTI